MASVGESVDARADSVACGAGTGDDPGCGDAGEQRSTSGLFEFGIGQLSAVLSGGTRRDLLARRLRQRVEVLLLASGAQDDILGDFHQVTSSGRSMLSLRRRR